MEIINKVNSIDFEQSGFTFIPSVFINDLSSALIKYLEEYVIDAIISKDYAGISVTFGLKASVSFDISAQIDNVAKELAEKYECDGIYLDNHKWGGVYRLTINLSRNYRKW